MTAPLRRPAERAASTLCGTTPIDRRLLVAVGAAAALAGLLAPAVGDWTLVVVAALALFVLTAWKPVVATYLYLATLPFLAGIQRDTLLPVVRPNEALLVLLISGALAGGYLRFLIGAPLRLRLQPLDVALGALVLLSTVWPLTSMMLRGIPPESSDLLAVLPVCKLAGLLLLVRTTIRTAAQRLHCIRIMTWTAAAISLIAILQTLQFGPIVSLLSSYWTDSSRVTDLTARGSTTLAHPIATGDYIVIGLALVIGCRVRRLLGRWEGLVLGLVLGAGALAAGQFSTWISVLVAAIVILHRNPELRRRALRFLPAVVPVVVIGAPAVLLRLEGFGGEHVLPLSWLTRWDNLTYFYLPKIVDFGFLIGVSPDSVLVPPDVWREQVFLESGYLQLLWVGGIPLLACFCWFSISLLRRVRELVKRPGSIGACAAALEVAWWMVITLSLFDIHLYLRGSGDMTFALIAISTRELNSGEASEVGRVRVGGVLPTGGAQRMGRRIVAGNLLALDRRARRRDAEVVDRKGAHE